MESTELSKTSDEIINELFSSLNVPLSPKPVGVEEWRIKGEQVSVHTGDSDNSEDEESDSKTSESDVEIKTTTEEVQEDSKIDKVEKVKSQKKKKDKRKKKKKHKKKEDGGRHKHKKKKKRESYETAEEAKLAADVLQDVKVKNQAFIHKIIQEEFRQLDVGHGKAKETCESKSKSPKLHRGSKSPDVSERADNIDEKKKPQKLHLQSNCKENLLERTVDSSSPSLRVTEYSSKDESSVPSLKVEESASKSAAKCNPSHEMSPGPEPGNDPTRACPTVSDSHKRKQSPHSHSPSPTCTKKLKSSHSSSSSKSSSPKPDFRYVSPSRSGSAKGSKSDCESKGRSRSRSRKRSISERSSSRTRSVSESRKSGSGGLKRSRSRSRKRSRSRSRKRSRSKKRSRSRSNSELRSRSKSKRKSRSESRDRSRSRSKKRSASKSSKNSQSKSRRSRSKERSKSRSRKRSESHSKRESSSKSRRSRGRSKSKSRRSRSRSHTRRSRSKSSKQSHSKSSRSRSRRKSGSRSRSRRSRSRSAHKVSPTKERFDMFAVMRERASRLAELKSQGIPDGSLGSLLLSSVQSLSLPMPDPSSIPLPHKDSLPTDSLKDEQKEESKAEVEEGKTSDNAVGENHVNLSPEEQEASKPREANRDKQEEGNEKSKAKTIITIKSLKDSIVFQQAQEEAERKAKENVHHAVAIEKCISNTELHKQQEISVQQKETEQNEVVSLTEKVVIDINRKDISEENDRRKEEKKEKGDEKRKDEEQERRETLTEIEGIIAKRQIEIETEETENIHSKEKKQMKAEEVHTKKETVDKHEDKEDSIGDIHSYIEEKEKRRENKQSCRAGEEDKGVLLSKADSEEETRNKQSSKSKEKESRERKVSSKREEKEEMRKIKHSKTEEEKGKGNKHSFSAEEDEDVKITTSHKSEEKDKVKKRSSKVGKKDEESKAKVSYKPFEEEDENIGKQSLETRKGEESNESKSHSNDESGKNGHAHPAQDSADKVEEGEIVSDKEVEVKSSSKTHSKKKSKKDKSSTKEKKSHKSKGKHKDERKKTSEKKAQDRARSRSKDKRRSRQQSSSKDHSHSRRHWRRTRSRSRSWSRSHSRDRSSKQHRRSHSRSRSRSRSKRRRESTSDLRDKVTRKRLLEIARRNAVYLMQNGCLPPSVEQEQLVKIKAGGKSVDELTDFCKQLVASGNYSDVDVSEPSISSEEENNSEKPFSSTRHPFSVRDSKPILMNIRNAPMLPTKTNAERLAGQAKLREQFPVSSGSQHRTKGEMSSSDGKHLSESEWVPVPPKEKKEEDKVFTRPEVPPVDISQIVSTRLSAMRKLQDNPNDSEAIKTLNNVQKEMQNWALSKQEPGQFTGTTGVKVLSQEELSSGHQAWARKEQFKEAAPVRPQFGLKMLQKMGWSPGEGLGKNKEGTTEPLLLDVKMDKKGFHAQEEVTPKKQPVPLVKDLSGKHPVSALVELCSKRKWSPPDFEMVFDCGPDHKKNFLMKVMVNGQEFKPSVAASTKKMAKANAAAAYLQSLGLYPKDPHYPL